MEGAREGQRGEAMGGLFIEIVQSVILGGGDLRGLVVVPPPLCRCAHR